MIPSPKSKNENIIPGIQIVAIIPIYIAERVLFFFNSSINSKFNLYSLVWFKLLNSLTQSSLFIVTIEKFLKCLKLINSLMKLR